MNPRIDLSLLAVPRDAPERTARVRDAGPRRKVLTRFVLPALLLVGFAGLMAHAGWNSLSPARRVTTMPVLTSQGALDAPVDTPLFRAAGWVEPRPTPILVTAQAEGVVEQLLVVEGQEVRQSQVVARLVAADARIALESAEAEVALRESEQSAAEAALTATRARLEVPLHLQADLADAETAVARAKSELTALPHLLAAAEARHDYAKWDHDGQRRSVDAVSRIAIFRAMSDRNAAAASVRELLARQKRLPVEIAALEAKREAQHQKLVRKIDEIRQVGESEAAVRSAKARVRQARAARDAAQLRLDRMVIRAPVSGVVLGLIARPGTRLNGLTASSLQDSSTVLTLYDPGSLQVRVDVRLDDVARVRVGQKVRVETAALPDQPLEGEVLRPTAQADIQKNTLSVKVALRNPPPVLRPEMLCQATFLAPPTPPRNGPRGTEPYRMLAPRALIDSSSGDPGLWVADRLAGEAHRRRVQLGGTMGELVEIVSGLGPQDRLIVAGREGLEEGCRIRITGEDEALGIGTSTARKRNP